MTTPRKLTQAPGAGGWRRPHHRPTRPGRWPHERPRDGHPGEVNRGSPTTIRPCPTPQPPTHSTVDGGAGRPGRPHRGRGAGGHRRGDPSATSQPAQVPRHLELRPARPGHPAHHRRAQLPTRRSGVRRRPASPAAAHPPDRQPRLLGRRRRQGGWPDRSGLHLEVRGHHRLAGVVAAGPVLLQPHHRLGLPPDPLVGHRGREPRARDHHRRQPPANRRPGDHDAPRRPHQGQRRRRVPGHGPVPGRLDL
jgi:hypothetical protein